MSLDSLPAQKPDDSNTPSDAFASSSLNIGPDVQRYREIIHGKIREDLQRHITSDEIIAQHGKDIISIPVKEITLPRFMYGEQKEGVGEGNGEGGDEEGSGEAGDREGKHTREQNFHIEELADMLGEHLELPRIKPRLASGLEAQVPRYESISRRGPSSLRDHRRTFLEALKRTVAEGSYDYDDPIIIPVNDDFRYRSPRLKPKPKTNAVIFYIIDVSGSMGDLEKSLARNTAFWTDAWIDRQYQSTEKCYIIHDYSAKVVDRDTFFTTRESGGTRISSAYALAREQMAQRFSPDEWNIYLFHFSDGENYSPADDDLCVNILKQDIVPYVNLFGYVEVGEHSHTGNFVRQLEGHFKREEAVVVTSMEDREDIIPGIRDLLGTGR